MSPAEIAAAIIQRGTETYTAQQGQRSSQTVTLKQIDHKGKSALGRYLRIRSTFPDNMPPLPAGKVKGAEQLQLAQRIQQWAAEVLGSDVSEELDKVFIY